ncbi:MAG: exonuclease domain-containing protein [Nocardioides sp.]|uniref:exonuclease domain-containing protein n=1 Tax=Nocardioides sp. TaxID=35761 RepID=UPI0039E22E46
MSPASTLRFLPSGTPANAPWTCGPFGVSEEFHESVGTAWNSAGMGLMDRFRKQATAPPQTQLTVRLDQPRFAVLDIETTGLTPQVDRILEIAVVTTDPWGRVLGEWSTRTNPDGPVGASHIHGITEADVAQAPVFRDVIAALIQQLAGAALVAHNAEFDLAFVREEFRRAGWEMPEVPALCTLRASTYHLPDLDRRRLADCCWAVGTPLTGAHSALGDARATAVLLASFMHPHVGATPLPEHLALPEQAMQVRWPVEPTGAPISSGLPPRLDGSTYTSLTPSQASTASETLVSMVDRFSLLDALGMGAPENGIAYLEELAQALEDGEISDQEATGLAALVQTMGLTDEDVTAANEAFVHALAIEALGDGKVSRAERAELLRVADILKVNPKLVPTLLDRAEAAREQRMSEGLAPLPADWSLGEPLRVGDKVAFTGCAAFNRPGMEERATTLGVHVIGSMSPRVALLVSDGTMDGGKAERARELGARVVHPNDFRTLLDHLQPVRPRQPKAAPRPRKTADPKSPVPAPVDMPDGITSADVREWGRQNGWEVGVRGRLNRDLLAAFVAAGERTPAAEPGGRELL